MGAVGQESLLRAAVERAKDWASSKPIIFALLFALPPFLIPASIGTVWNIPAGLIALAAALVVWFLLLIVSTFMGMFNDLRLSVAALEARVAGAPSAVPLAVMPADAVVPEIGFDCELVDREDEWVQVEVHNRASRSTFYARVKEVRGEKTNGTWPRTVRWQADNEAGEREIGGDDLEVLNVVRIRGRRAVDFLSPETTETPFERVEAIADGEQWQVLAHLVVYRKMDDREVERQERFLRLRFANGNQLPTERQLLPIDGTV